MDGFDRLAFLVPTPDRGLSALGTLADADSYEEFLDRLRCSTRKLF